MEEEDVLAHQADRAAEVFQGQVANVVSVQPYRALAGVVEAQQQLDERRLARPGRADERHAGSGRDAHVDVGEHRGPVCIREPDALVLHLARDLGSGQAGRAALDAQRRVEQVEDAPRRGHGTLVLVEDVAQTGQRPQQALGHEHEHAVQADVEAAIGGHAGAEHQGRSEPEHDAHADQRHERGAQSNRGLVGATVGLAVAFEVPRLDVLGHERLDRCDAPELVGQARGHVGRSGTDRLVARGELALEPQRSQHHDRRRCDRQGGDRRHRHDEQHTDGQHRGRQLDDLVGTIVEEALELVDVVAQHRHQSARGAVLEVGQLQALHVRVGVTADLVLQGLREVAPRERIRVLE